jgi:hypothetical protein
MKGSGTPVSASHSLAACQSSYAMLSKSWTGALGQEKDK